MGKGLWCNQLVTLTMRNEATNGGCQIDLKGQEKFAKGIQDTLQKGHKEPKVTVIS